jgi:hypothetical protein
LGHVAPLPHVRQRAAAAAAAVHRHASDPPTAGLPTAAAPARRRGAHAMQKPEIRIFPVRLLCAWSVVFPGPGGGRYSDGRPEAPNTNRKAMMARERMSDGDVRSSPSD